MCFAHSFSANPFRGWVMMGWVWGYKYLTPPHTAIMMMLCLVFSSFLFTIPALYAYMNDMLLYAALLVATSLVSANYWRDPFIPSWRKNADLLVAKISFTIFVTSGIMYVRELHFLIVGYSGLLVLMCCYHQSCMRFQRGDKYWYIYHFAFHVIMMCEQLIILHQYNNINN